MALPNDVYELWGEYITDAGTGMFLARTFTLEASALELANPDANVYAVGTVEVWHIHWAGITILGNLVVARTATKIYP